MNADNLIVLLEQTKTVGRLRGYEKDLTEALIQLGILEEDVPDDVEETEDQEEEDSDLEDSGTEEVNDNLDDTL